MSALSRLLLDPEPLTPAMLGVAYHSALTDRITTYLSIAGVAANSEPSETQYQRVLSLIYGARIVVLEGEVEKFRAEGEVTIERDLQSRIARLVAARDAALALTRATDGSALGDFAPYIGEWRLGP